MDTSVDLARSHSPPRVARRYLMVVPVPFHPLPGGRAAVEGAFAEHLRMLFASMQPHIDVLEVVAPTMDAAAWQASRSSMHDIDPAVDRILFTAAFPMTTRTVGYLLGLPRVLGRLWRAVGRSAFVHAGPSHLLRPFENVALVFGWLRRRTTVYVTDIDHRQSPRMNLATGRWRYSIYWRARYVHRPWMSLQHHLARVLCSVLLLKGRALVRDFGRGRSHVHYILDCAHAEWLVLDPARQAAKWARMGDPRRPLRACYFGRLVPYKGVDRMIHAILEARRAKADVTFDIYGMGDSEPELQAQVRQLGLTDVVHFHGARPYGKDFFAELEQCDLLLAAPLSEDTPRSAIDAQALGMGVLAFDTYYYRELSEQEAGVVVVAWPDVAAMAATLQDLSSHRDRLVALGRRGITFALQNTQEYWLRQRAAWTLGTS